MSMSAREMSAVTVNVNGRLATSEFSIKMLAEVDVHDQMYSLAEGKYKYAVQVADMLIPAHDEGTAKHIAQKMAGLIMNVAIEARKK